MSKSQTPLRRRLLRAGIATAATAAAVAATTTPAYATAVPVTLSATTGAASTLFSPGVTVVASSTSAWLATAGATPAVLFTTATSCTDKYPTSVPSNAVALTGSVTKFSSYKGSFSTAAAASAPTATTKYLVCIYTGSTGGTDSVIGSASYTAYVSPTGGAADATSGPSSGGTLVTVTGATGLPTTLAGYGAVTLGGVQVESLKPIDATSFSFVTPPHAKSTANEHLLVNTATGGLDDITTGFQYYSAITVTPNYVSGNGADVPIDITGAGFTALNNVGFGALIDTATPHVFLTRGAYDTSGNSANTYTTATVPVTECASVVYVSDNEILCTLKITKTLNLTSTFPKSTATPYGAYSVVVVANSTIGAALSVALPSEITPSATFTVSSK